MKLPVEENRVQFEEKHTDFSKTQKDTGITMSLAQSLGIPKVIASVLLLGIAIVCAAVSIYLFRTATSSGGLSLGPAEIQHLQDAMRPKNQSRR